MHHKFADESLKLCWINNSFKSMFSSGEKTCESKMEFTHLCFCKPGLFTCAVIFQNFSSHKLKGFTKNVPEQKFKNGKGDFNSF